MRHKLSFGGIAFLMASFVLHGAPCAALGASSEAGGTTVNLQPLFNHALQLLGLVLMGIGSWAAKWLGNKFKLDSLSPELEKLVHEGVQFGTNKLKRLASSRAKVDVGSEIAAEALSYVTRNGPRMIKKLGYSQEQLRDKILSQIAPDEQSDDQATAGSGAK